MRIHIGTSGYAYPEWRGRFYPERISSKKMLRFYSERFRTVEINHTFYRMPQENVLAAWADQVPDDFRFAFKSPRVITHLKKLRDVSDEIGYFFKTLALLNGKLGPVLFQFPRSFHADRQLLQAFLESVPGGVCAFEFRSPTWSDREIFGLLRERGASLCTVDSDEHRADAINPTARWGYLRLRRSGYTDADLSQWFNRILSQEWEQAFVFFKHEEKAAGAEAALRFRDLAAAQDTHNDKQRPD